MKQARIILVGSQNLGGVIDDGETMKNYMLSKQMESIGCKVCHIDTRNRPKRLYYILKYLCNLLIHRDSIIVMSASPFVANKMFMAAKMLGWNSSQQYYWVIGGTFGKHIAEGTFSKSLYLPLKKIVVEGDSMKQQLDAVGFRNIKVLPNFKDITYIPVRKANTTGNIRFVFLSRVMPEKGVDYIIEASKKLIQRGFSNFIVHLYGKIAPSYEKILNEMLKDLTNVEYRGFLMLDKPEGYNKLASYDLMLFPTYWHGEGFPGILIDAFIAGLPVIATDWNLNSSLITEGETGMLIPVHNVCALAEAMEKSIKGRINIKVMSENAQRQAMKYDAKNVITPELLKEFEII